MCGSVDGLCLCVCGFVVVGLWLKWVVGRRRSPVFRFGEVGSGVSHGLSLISHHGSASWVWIGGLGSIDGGFETVDLLIGGWIGWVDHQ